MRLAVVIASIIFLFSTTIGFYSYNEIISNEQPGELSIKGVSLGNSHFSILKSGKCLAYFNTDFKLEPEIVLIYNGAFKINFEKKDYLSQIKGWVFFNAFNQLVHAEVKIDFSNVEIQIVSKNTNPLDITFEVNSIDSIVKKNFQISGPVIVKKDKEGKYFLDLGFLLKTFPEMQIAGINFQETVKQNIEVVSDPSACLEPKDLINAIELDKIKSMPFNFMGLIR